MGGLQIEVYRRYNDSVTFMHEMASLGNIYKTPRELGLTTGTTIRMFDKYRYDTPQQTKDRVATWLTYDSPQYWLDQTSVYTRLDDGRVPRMHVSIYRPINIVVTAKKRNKILDVLRIEVNPGELVHTLRRITLENISVKLKRNREWGDLKLDGRAIDRYCRLNGKEFYRFYRHMSQSLL